MSGWPLVGLDDADVLHTVRAMGLVAAVVSGASGHSTHAMLALRGSLVVALCSPLVADEADVVAQLPLPVALGTGALSFHLGSAVLNAAVAVGLLVFGAVATAVYGNVEDVGLLDSAAVLRFPSVAVLPCAVCGIASLRSAAVLLTNSSASGSERALGAGVVAVWVLLFAGAVLVVTALFGAQFRPRVAKITEDGRIIEGVQRGAGREGPEAVAAPELPDHLKHSLWSLPDSVLQSSTLSPGTEGDDRAASFFQRLSRSFAVSFARPSVTPSPADDGSDASDWDALNDTATAGVLADAVYRAMFRQARLLGSDRDALIHTIVGSGVWEDAPGGARHFVRRYSALFANCGPRNRGFFLVDAVACIAVALLSGVYTDSAAVSYRTQAFGSAAVLTAYALLVVVLRPLLSSLNTWGTAVVGALHAVAALLFGGGSVAEKRPLGIAGVTVAMIALYVSLAWALVDAYMLILDSVADQGEEDWPEIARLTELYLDAHREATAPPAVEEHLGAFTQLPTAQALREPMGAKSEKEVDQQWTRVLRRRHYSSSRAVPEAFHPFVQRPIPERYPVATRARVREWAKHKHDTAAADKWSRTFDQLCTMGDEAPTDEGPRPEAPALGAQWNLRVTGAAAEEERRMSQRRSLLRSAPSRPPRDPAPEVAAPIDGGRPVLPVLVPPVLDDDFL